MSGIGFYSGSFDPPTLGHLDIMRRGLDLFDKLVVGVGVNPSKTPFFSDMERADMVWEELRGASEDRAEVVLFQGLAITAAQKHGARTILRGLRDTVDFAYEMQMAGMNAVMAPKIETVFLGASPGVGHVAATLVRQIATMGGDPSPFVSPAVLARINEKVRVLRG